MNNRIKEVRKSLALTQEAFAERIGMKRNSVAMLESGGRTPSELAITAICREFGVNRIWLETGAGEMFVERTRDEELAHFFADLLKDDPSFKHRLISVLARTSEAEWELIEQFALRLMEEMKNADPDKGQR